jgi:lipopolysaccharide transport system ATP-binding protein
MKHFRNQGVAIVFISHHLPAVAQLCNQLLLLDSGTPLRLGSPADVIAAYCSGVGPDDRDEVSVSATLGSKTTTRAGGGAFKVEPGDEIVLDVTLEFRVDTAHATIGVVVWDLTRELYVYGASSDFIGMPLLHAHAGEVRHFTFRFDANLTRGLYAIEVNVVDLDRHRFLAVARGIRHFQVVEQVSYDGVANLYLRGKEATDGIRAVG